MVDLRIYSATNILKLSKMKSKKPTIASLTEENKKLKDLLHISTQLEAKYEDRIAKLGQEIADHLFIKNLKDQNAELTRQLKISLEEISELTVTQLMIESMVQDVNFFTAKAAINEIKSILNAE